VTEGETPVAAHRCAQCGALDCARLHEEMLALGVLTRAGHDAYSVQHEERYCGRAKGLAAHLGGLCVAVEHRAHPNVYRQLHRWLDRTDWRKVPYPPPQGIPRERGAITIADVHRALAGSSDEYARVLDAWVRSAWEAFGPLQPLARAWVAEALALR
jgi:hypothetical protein